MSPPGCGRLSDGRHPPVIAYRFPIRADAGSANRLPSIAGRTAFAVQFSLRAVKRKRSVYRRGARVARPRCGRRGLCASPGRTPSAWRNAKERLSSPPRTIGDRSRKPTQGAVEVLTIISRTFQVLNKLLLQKTFTNKQGACQKSQIGTNCL